MSSRQHLLSRTATGLRSAACASNPRRAASRGIEPPPAKGSSTGGSSPPQCLSISAFASAYTSGCSCIFFCIKRRRISKRRSRSAFCISSVGKRSGWEEGSSTTEAKSTARAVGSGRRAHQWWMPLGCAPMPGILSYAEASLISASGSATSMSFFLQLICHQPEKQDPATGPRDQARRTAGPNEPPLDRRGQRRSTPIGTVPKDLPP